MMTPKQIEKEVLKIKTRNKKVEGDKAWELSWTRKATIMLFTYLALGVYMFAVGIVNPWLNAVVPTIAFALATLTLPYFKEMWLRHVYNRD
jgi:hypothetical protein